MVQLESPQEPVASINFRGQPRPSESESIRLGLRHLYF